MKIYIKRAEGPSNLCGKTYEFNSFSKATSHIRSYGNTYPEVGYDKHDVKIVFDGGETWKARLDCKHPSCEGADLDVYEHCINNIKFYLGQYKPSHMTKQEYEKFVASNSKVFPSVEFENFLDLFETQYAVEQNQIVLN